MILNFIQLNLEFPQQIDPPFIRGWILNQLKPYGEPLRWALTSIDNKKDNNSNIRVLKVEAVVITN